MSLRPSRSLTAAHWRRLQRIREVMAATVITQWRREGFGNADVDATVRTILTAQRAIVRATEADMAVMVGLATGTQITTAGIDADALIGRAARNGTLLEEVYTRPKVVARNSGFDAGLTYLRQAINLDSQMAQRRAANAVVEADTRIVGWRRQVNPGSGGTCGLCVAASTQLYRKQSLMAIHPMCRCSVYPVMASDPLRSASYIDRERLDEVYTRSGGATDRSSLGAIRFSAEDLPPGIDSEAISALGARVAYHPEWGEYLTGANHASSFTV